MLGSILLQEYLESACPEIHSKRLQSVMDVATALQHSKKLSLTSIARSLDNDTEIKHRVKKVDRLLGNEKLYRELGDIYSGLSAYVFQYISQDLSIPVIIDLCYLKDTHDIQMLSAEVATQGRSIPIYREVFGINQLKGRAESFMINLKKYLPSDRKALIIMDAGFGDDWFEAIEAQDCYWLVRARGKKFIKLPEEEDWLDARKLYEKAGTRGKNYSGAFITKKNPRACRVILKKGVTTSKRKRPEKLPRGYNSANGNYQRLAKEPWVLATNLPEEYKTAQVINYYKKRMQIEESFRDIKSHQFGLGGRYVRTRCVYRWAVMMLLAAIAQITLWIIGVIGHSQGFQRKFQSNTVRDRKVFSYFYMGQLIVEYGKLHELNFDYDNLATIIAKELQREW